MVKVFRLIFVKQFVKYKSVVGWRGRNKFGEHQEDVKKSG